MVAGDEETIPPPVSGFAPGMAASRLLQPRFLCWRPLARWLVPTLPMQGGTVLLRRRWKWMDLDPHM
eukprot:5247335-Prorocentrum_lima.AAC.1